MGVEHSKQNTVHKIGVLSMLSEWDCRLLENYYRRQELHYLKSKGDYILNSKSSE